MRATLLVLAACGSSAPATHDAAIDSVDRRRCPTVRHRPFGNELTSALGRLDGTILAVAEPGNTACAMPNSRRTPLRTTC